MTDLKVDQKKQIANISQLKPVDKSASQKDIKINFSNPKVNEQTPPKKEEKVGFWEGCNLLAKGFANKAVDLGKTIVQHPLKTAAIVVGTVAVIAALPVIGVSSAVGASVLAVGAAGVAIYNGAKHLIKTVKHNEDGKYNEMRKDLKDLGGDGFDMALSLPFAPKGISTLTKAAKYAPKPSVNTELIGNIKNADGVGNKVQQVFNADLKIKYEQMTNEMGLKSKPELIFDKNLSANSQASFDPVKGTITMNENYLNPIFNLKAKIKTPSSNFNSETTIRHELEHFVQFSDIARTEGIEVSGLVKGMQKFHIETLADTQANLNEVTAALTKLRNYVPKNAVEKVKLSQKITELEKMEIISKAKAQLSRDMAVNPESTMNTSLYQNVAKEKGSIKAETEGARKSQEYLYAVLDKPKNKFRVNALRKRAKVENMPQEQLKKEIIALYKDNALEKPAYQVERDYLNNVLKRRPGYLTSSVQSADFKDN